MLARLATLAAVVLGLAPLWPDQVWARNNTATQAAIVAARATIPDSDETMLRMSSLLASLARERGFHRGEIGS